MNGFDVLAPIFLVTGLGWLLRVSGFLAPVFFTGMNRLTFYIALPALLFVKISPPSAVGGQVTAWPVTVVVLGAMVVCVAVGYGVCLAGRWRGRAVGAVVQAGFRGNLAYVGLPVVFYALNGISPQAGEDWGRVAALAIGPVIPVYNVLSVAVLLGGREPWSLAAAGRALVRAVTNPLVVACVLGVVFSRLALPMPVALMRAATTVAEMALPLALLSIGASLTREGMARSGAPAVAAALIKVLVAPVAGLGLAAVLGLDPEQTLVALIFCACPTAVASYVMAEQLGSDEHIAAGAVMISTLLSALSLAAVLTWG
jgi:malate permease and related proteins